MSHFFASPKEAENSFRMGVTSIAADKIREGVEQLAQLIRSMASDTEENLDSASGELLSESNLRQHLTGNRLLSKTVYGDPFSIELRADGSLIGMAGYRNEDCDNGRWWVEEGKWYRCWDKWAYAETAGFFIVLDGNRVKMFNDDKQKVFSAVLTNDPWP